MRTVKPMGMNAKIIIISLLCLPLLASAQTVDNSAQKYSVRYEKEHLFLQKEGGFNVVDYNVEWPDIIDFSEVLPLKRFISNDIFGIATTSLDSALMSVNEVYGQPVTGKLQTIPDDNRFCYVTSMARILSYNPNRWIAYQLQRVVKPGKLSTFKPQESSRVIVYDLTRQRVMLADDMIKDGVMNGTMPQNFYDRLFAPLSDDMYNSLLSAKISGVWIDQGQICLLVDAISADDATSYTVVLPYDDFSYILTRDVHRMVEKELKAVQPQFVSLPVTWKGDSVYNKVEQMPEFKGGNEGLRRYLSFVDKPSVTVSKAERVFVSFIVDKEGKVCDVSVVQPVSPEIDSHAVGVIKGMPAFTPGRHNGKQVCVRLFMPISYKP